MVQAETGNGVPEVVAAEAVADGSGEMAAEGDTKTGGGFRVSSREEGTDESTNFLEFFCFSFLFVNSFLPPN